MPNKKRHAKGVPFRVPSGRCAHKVCAISAQSCLQQGGRTGLPQQAA